MDILFYKLQDEINDVKKTRTLTAIEGTYPLTLSGTLRSGASKIAPVIDFGKEITYFNEYNYAYIADFGRYYFIDNMTAVRKDLTTISFRVDVLTSFLTQTGASNLLCYVGRTANSTYLNKYVPDNRIQFETRTDINVTEPSSLESNAENVVFSMNPSNDVVFSTSSSHIIPTYDSVSVPSPLQNLAGVSSISFSKFRPAGNNLTYVTSHYSTSISKLLRVALAKSDVESCINNITIFPFSVPHADTNTAIWFLDDPVIDPDQTGVQMTLPLISNPNSGYLVLKDFMFSTSSQSVLVGDFRDYEPYSKCEIYIPFVGWTNLNIKENINCRLMVIYNVDYITGQANVYIFNKTKEAIIYQTTAQIGISIPYNTSNMKENELKDQNYTRNYLTGMATSFVAGVAGAVSGNYMLMAGGMAGIVTTSVQYVNNENLLLDKATPQVSNSSGTAGTFSGFKVLLRLTRAKMVMSETALLTHIKEQGLPCNRLLVLSELVQSGDYHTYAEITDLHIHTMPETPSSDVGYLKDITHPEVEELKSLCSQGIYL